MSTSDSRGRVPGGTRRRIRPEAGDLPIERVFDRLDDRGYEGALVVELDPPYRTRAAVGDTVDYLHGHC